MGPGLSDQNLQLEVIHPSSFIKMFFLSNGIHIKCFINIGLGIKITSVFSQGQTRPPEDPPMKNVKVDVNQF